MPARGARGGRLAADAAHRHAVWRPGQVVDNTGTLLEYNNSNMYQVVLAIVHAGRTKAVSALIEDGALTPVAPPLSY